jgi:ribosomal protein L11 methyltransferase
MLRLAAERVGRAEHLLELAGAESIALADAADDPVLEPDPHTTPLWPHVVVRAVFPTSADLGPLCAVLREACAAEDCSAAPLEDNEWQDAIRQVFSARPVGRRVWLAPADETAAPPDRVLVRLHMGLAFGTGEHATTALCLDWIDANLRAGSTLLDYGCGSGVLAITALALGADYCFAVDNDSQAVAATAANATLNGVTERLLVCEPSELPAAEVDIVVANILAAPLIRVAGELAAHVKPGGSIALSGILSAQGDAVVSAYAPYFKGFTRIERGGWLCIAAERRSA